MGAGVGQQVGENLVQPVLVALDRDRFGRQVKHPAVAGAGRPRVAGRVDGQPGQVDRLAGERPAGVEPGEQQQVVDEPAHPLRLRVHPAKRGTGLRPEVTGAQRKLGVPANARKRRA